MLRFGLSLSLGAFFFFSPSPIFAATVGPGPVNTTVTESSGGTTTILGYTTIDTTGSGGNAVKVTNGTVEFGGTNIQVKSNAIGLFINSNSFPAYLNSLMGSELIIMTEGSNDSHGIAVEGSSAMLSLSNTSIRTLATGAKGILINNGASANLSNLSIETLGVNGAEGIAAQNNSILNLNGASIITHNAGSSAIRGSTSNLNLSNVNLSTEADFGYGMNVGNNSSLFLDGAIIQTQGANAAGILSQSGSNLTITNLTLNTRAVGININNSSLTLSDATITTTGRDGIFGLAGNNSSINVDNTTIITNTNSSIGISMNVSDLILTNATIQTYGISSFGLRATDSTASISNVSINTEGMSAIGVNSMGNTNITLSGSEVNTYGQSAHGLRMDGGTFTVTDSTIQALGPNAVGLSFNNLPLASRTVSFSNATLSSQQAAAISITGGTNSISLDHSSVSGATTWLQANSGTTTLNANQTNLTGTAQTIVGSTNLSLNNNSIWTLTGSSNLTQLNLTNSEIVFSAPFAQYKTLTLATYSGQDASITLNTFLNADNSPSDQLIINGGTATGHTDLLINNVLGEGAETLGNGILLVSTVNGGTTEEGAFSLGAPVVAGPYEYFLFRGSLDESNPNNWYLRSFFDDEVHFRKEVSLYAAVPSLLINYSRNLLGTFHQRVGAEEEVQKRWQAGAGSPLFNGSWLRAVHRDGRINNQSALFDGPNFNYRIYALQGGIDLYHQQYASGHRDFVGVFANGGDNHSSVEHYTQEKAGKANFKAYGGGFYWTHMSPNGAYLDAVIQGNGYDLQVYSSSQILNAPMPRVYAYSLESGWPFVLGNKWSFEPEAQIAYQVLPGFAASDSVSALYMNKTESLIGRVSGRLVWNRDPITTFFPKKRNNMTVWLTPSISYESKGNAITQFASSTGAIPFFSTLQGLWFSMDLGSTLQIKDYFSLYGTLMGETYLNGRGQAYAAVLGCRLNI